MPEQPTPSILTHFAHLEDPRIDRTEEHLLLDIVAIAICAVICGAESWVDIEAYGEAKQDWLRQCLSLPNGIPSHDTFARVFARLDSQQQLRHSYDKGANRGAISMVSAWATSNRLVLGQRQVTAKSNEITAIPALLHVLELSGCIVTIDAMGAHTGKDSKNWGKGQTQKSRMGRCLLVQSPRSIRCVSPDRRKLLRRTNV